MLVFSLSFLYYFSQLFVLISSSVIGVSVYLWKFLVRCADGCTATPAFMSSIHLDIVLQSFYLLFVCLFFFFSLSLAVVLHLKLELSDKFSQILLIFLIIFIIINGIPSFLSLSLIL